MQARGDTPVSGESPRTANWARGAAFRNPIFVGSIFAALFALHVLGYLVLGTGRSGLAVSEVVLVLENLLALVCIQTAFHRAKGAAALFWALYATSHLFMLMPNLLISYSTVANDPIVPTEIWRVLYSLYGAPIVMMLLLPAVDSMHRLKSEVFLDLFQVAIVVALAFTTFFYIPIQQMLPNQAIVRNVNLSNLLAVSLMVGVLARLRLAPSRAGHDLMARLGIYLLVSGVITYAGNWIDLHEYTTLSAWWYLGWALCYITPGMAAITWRPATAGQPAAEPPRFVTFLRKNLVLVAILVCIDLMMERWKAANGAALTNLAVGASLFALTLRLALTQYSKQREIADREAAQDDLRSANETISGLLEQTRIEASSIAQINELGNVLRGAVSREEALTAIPERLARLFPGTSGAIAMRTAGKIHADPVVVWGGQAPSLQNDVSSACGQQRECSPVSIPLLAHGEVVGLLTIQNDQHPDPALPETASERARCQQLGGTVAEHIVLTISNLDLREALRNQATHDPLTGLYNRRYMQEFLEREMHRAHRRERPLAVLLLDIDHFKRFNDTFGHPAGDQALRLAAETLLRSVRAEDLACRYGGEEFVVLLPECTLQQAAVRAEEIRSRLQRLYHDQPGEIPQEITASIGASAFPETTREGELLLKCADEALYEAKHAGRNRVATAKSAKAAASQP